MQNYTDNANGNVWFFNFLSDQGAHMFFWKEKQSFKTSFKTSFYDEIARVRRRGLLIKLFNKLVRINPGILQYIH